MAASSDKANEGGWTLGPRLLAIEPWNLIEDQQRIAQHARRTVA